MGKRILLIFMLISVLILMTSCLKDNKIKPADDQVVVEDEPVEVVDDVQVEVEDEVPEEEPTDEVEDNSTEEPVEEEVEEEPEETEEQITDTNTLLLLNIEDKMENESAYVDEVFTANLTIDKVKDLRTYDVRITYDKSKLELRSFVDGSFLKEEGKKLVELDRKGEGFAYITRSRESLKGKSGEGPLLFMFFKVLAVGETNITIESAKLANSRGEEIIHDVQNLQLMIEK